MIHIDNHLEWFLERESDQESYYLFKDNTFNKNMAYFEGNAIYIQGNTEENQAIG